MYELYNNDCIEQLKILIDKNVRVDSIIIDPPYDQTHTKLRWNYAQANKNFNRRLAYELATQLVNKNAHFVIFGYGMQLYKDAIILEELGWNFQREFIWNKGNASHPSHKVPKIHETFLAFTKGNRYNKECFYNDYYNDTSITADSYKHLLAHFNQLKKVIKTLSVEDLKKVIDNIGKREYALADGSWDEWTSRHLINHDEAIIKTAFNKRVRTVIQIPRVVSKIHPTIKPDVLMDIVVKMNSNENDTVLDFFMGTGSTGVAAIKNNRNFIGIDSYKPYYDYAQQRLIETEKVEKSKLF